MRDIRQSRRTQKKVHADAKPKANGGARMPKAASEATIKDAMNKMDPAKLLEMLMKVRKG